MHADCQRHGLGYVFREVIQPESFNRFRFSRYAKDISKAFQEMSVFELKDALRDIPGIEGLTVGYSASGQIIHLADKSVEVGPMASNEEIRAALQNPFVPTETGMSITGLQQGAFQAKLAEMRQKVADSQANGLAKIDGVVTAGIAELEAAANNAASKANKEISDALQEFGLTTNGGPA